MSSLPAHLYHWGLVYQCPICGLVTSDGELLKSEYPEPPKQIYCGSHTEDVLATRVVAVPRHIGPVHSDTESWATALGVAPKDITGARSVERAMDERGLRPATDQDLRASREFGLDTRSRINAAQAAGARNEDPSDMLKMERTLKLEDVAKDASPKVRQNAALTMEATQTGVARDPTTGKSITFEHPRTMGGLVPVTPAEVQGHRAAESAQTEWYRRAYQGPIEMPRGGA